jgi:hypothetical protein
MWWTVYNVMKLEQSVREVQEVVCLDFHQVVEIGIEKLGISVGTSHHL